MKKWLGAVLAAVCLVAFIGCGKPEPVKTEGVKAEAVAGETSYVAQISKQGCPKNSIVLVSWNACNFGRSKSPETIAFMAKLLREADIVALQEVSTSDFGAQAVARLCDELNRTGAKWDYVVSDPTHDSAAKERFAFLWKTSRIQAVPRKAVLFDVLKDKLAREPAKIHFRIDGNRELTLVSFHLAPARSQARVAGGPTAKNPEAEVNALGKDPAEFSGGNVVFVGDFNLSHRELNPVFENAFKARHWIEGKTSLKAKSGRGEYYVHKEYDNIYTRGEMSVCKSAILDFVPSFGSLKEAKKISDAYHLPRG